MVKIENKKSNIFGDDIAYVESWDFSQANMSEDNRINAITQVASICYQNPKALNSDSLYNRLMAESMGLPSSSFEFVPVLIPLRKIYNKLDVADINIQKFGEHITHNSVHYLLTNYRALICDVENNILERNWLDFYNTEYECEIIKKNFKVFNYKVDIPTRTQMVRHRISWQELSRRYVSGKRVPFDFYVSEKMKGIYTIDGDASVKGSKVKVCFTIKDIIDTSLKLYFDALENGVKPQEARRIIPQAAYTQIWGAFQPAQYENFMKLRDDEIHAQWEIAQVAKAMRELS